MTKRTRYFMTGALALMVMGLGVGLVAFYGEFPSLIASPTSGPSELSFVPADASVVAYANVKDVMNSEFRQRLKDAMPHETQAQDDFRLKTGINIETDIDYVVAWMGADGEEGGGLVLARGQFRDGQLEALAREHGGQVTEYRRKRIVIGSGPLHDDDDDEDADDDTEDTDQDAPAAHMRRMRNHNGALAFLGDGLVAVGQESAVKRAIDAHEDGKNLVGNVEMMKLVGEIETGSNVWAVGRLDAIRQRHHLPEQVKTQLSSVKWFAATGRVNGGVAGTFRAEARDDQAAENLRDVVRGFLALARLQAGTDQKYANLLQSLQLTGSGTTVALSFEVPAEIFDLVGLRHRRGDIAEPPAPPQPPQPPTPPQPDR